MTAAANYNEHENIEAEEGSDCDEYGVVDEGGIGSDDDGFFFERLGKGEIQQLWKGMPGCKGLVVLREYCSYRF